MSEALTYPIANDDLLAKHELSMDQLTSIKLYASKHLVKRSAKLIGDCCQLGSLPFEPEYVRMANDCGFILKDDNGIPLACIMD